MLALIMMVQSLLFMKVRRQNSMKKIEAWLSKKGLKNKRTLIVVIAFVLFIIFLFLLLNSNSEDSGNITITENA